MNKTVWILVAISLLVAVSIVPSGHSSTPTPVETVNLYTGNTLKVSSSQPSVQSVVIQGNLTAATFSNTTYPAKSFSLTTNSTQLYTLNVTFSYPSTYTSDIIIYDPVAHTNSQYTSFYVSDGALVLTIFASFQPPPGTGTGAAVSWSSLLGWFFQFGNAFPLWIKVLYGILGAQFAYVGFRWIKFEDDRRRTEGHLPPLDRGNKVYLWIDVVFRVLLTGFIISLAIMIGEVLVITVAQYLFFVSLNLFSLVDFFSLFFVAALGTIVYLMREGLDKFFDLKPLMED